MKSYNKILSHILIIVVYIFLSSMLFFNCERRNSKLDLSTLSWIDQYGYNSEEVISANIRGRIPGPKIPVTIGTETHFCMIDLSHFGLILKDNAFDEMSFEPQRIVSLGEGDGEMMLEEGFLTNCTIFGQDYETLYSAMLKSSNIKIPSSGLVGRNFLLGGRITFDLSNNVLSYSKRTLPSLSEISKSGQIIKIDLSDENLGNTGLIKFSGTIKGRPICMTLNTRSRHSLISPELVREIAGEKQAGKKFFALDSLYVGDYLFLDQVCELNPEQLTLEPRYKEPIHLSIGLETLQDIIATIDFNEELFMIEEPVRIKDAD